MLCGGKTQGRCRTVWSTNRIERKRGMTEAHLSSLGMGFLCHFDFQMNCDVPIFECPAFMEEKEQNFLLSETNEVPTLKFRI